MIFAEVVIHEVRRYRMSVHLNLLAERVSEPSEAAHVHPHCEILPLHVRRGDMACVWVASDDDAFGPSYLRRRIAMGGAAGVDEATIVFLQHCIINVDAEGVSRARFLGMADCRRHARASEKT